MENDIGHVRGIRGQVVTEVWDQGGKKNNLSKYTWEPIYITVLDQIYRQITNEIRYGK